MKVYCQGCISLTKQRNALTKDKAELVETLEEIKHLSDEYSNAEATSFIMMKAAHATIYLTARALLTRMESER